MGTSWTVLVVAIAFGIAAAYAMGRHASSNAAGFSGGLVLGFVVVVGTLELLSEPAGSRSTRDPGEAFWYVVLAPGWALIGALAVAVGRSVRAYAGNKDER